MKSALDLIGDDWGDVSVTKSRPVTVLVIKCIVRGWRRGRRGSCWCDSMRREESAGAVEVDDIGETVSEVGLVVREKKKRGENKVRVRRRR